MSGAACWFSLLCCLYLFIAGCREGFSPSNDSLAAVRGRRWIVSLLMFVFHPSRGTCFVAGRSVCVFASVAAVVGARPVWRVALGGGQRPPQHPGGNVTPLVLGTPTMGAAAAGTVGGGGADPGCGGAWQGRPPPPTQHTAWVRRRPHHTMPPPRRASRVVQAAAALVAAARRLLPARQHAAGRHGPSTPPPPPLQMALVPRGPGPPPGWAAVPCLAGLAVFLWRCRGMLFPRPDFLFPKVVNHGGMR